jgi:hypothetical protein
VLNKVVEAGALALYKLEKRLLDRFPREKVYVRSFFFDAAPLRKKPEKKGEPEAAQPGPEKKSEPEAKPG